MNEKSSYNGTLPDPNTIIAYLSSRILSNEESEILQYGLIHGLATKPRQSDILASAECIWDQISKLNVCKVEHDNIERTKVSIRDLAFNLLDLVDNQMFKDTRKLNIIKNLRKEVMILKPDKGNGIVLLDTNDYISSVQQLFSDTKTVQRMLNLLELMHFQRHISL